MYDIWDEERNVLFFGSSRDLRELTTLVSNCLNVLREATCIRQMVLETWLVVDYAIRKFLLAGFELARFCDEDFDLLDKLLPREFPALLKDTVDYNRKLPLKPEPINIDRFGGFTASFEFWEFIKSRHPEFLKQIEEIQKEYIIEHNPDLTEGETVAFLHDVYPDGERKVAKIRLGWREVACALDKKWFKLAEQLNKARNKAAHSLLEDKIARSFGLTGSNTLALTKEKCFSIMSTLLGLKEKAMTK